MRYYSLKHSGKLINRVNVFELEHSAGGDVDDDNLIIN